MDITETLAPTTDQLDAIELVSGPQTFTVARVTKNNAEQPINVHLVEFPRPWRPGKNMRRVLADCWGADASEWPGRRVTLYYDPDVKFGNEQPGGTRIKALSHIDKPRTVPLLISRGKSAMYPVEPLANEPTTEERLASLRAEHKHANPERQKEIMAEAEALGATPKQSREAKRQAIAEAQDVNLPDPTLDPDWQAE